MGVYNTELTLVEALDSLLNQTYKDFEIIICDDGSTDNTYEIVKEYALKNKNINLIKNDKNRGLSYSLNHCLKYAKGEYIARMDGDDISMPTRFEKEVNILDNNLELSIVSTAMIHFDENGKYKVGHPIKYPQEIDFMKGTPFCHAPCMVRKVAYDSINGYCENKHIWRVEDYDLWFRMYAKGFRGYNIEEPLYKMRDDRNSYSHRTFRARINEAYVKYIGFKSLKLPIYCYIYVFRPILIGLLPYKVYIFFRKKFN